MTDTDEFQKYLDKLHSRACKFDQWYQEKEWELKKWLKID